MNRLTDSEISDRLRSLEGWEVRDSRLVKSFKFKDFMSAVHFVDEIAPLAVVLHKVIDRLRASVFGCWCSNHFRAGGSPCDILDLVSASTAVGI